MNATAEAIKELMECWDTMMEAAINLFPRASEDEIYQIVAGRMDNEIHRMKEGDL